ncbi:MAG: hypothetical protein ACQ9MH_16670 [Nitrospinales bacterium]
MTMTSNLLSNTKKNSFEVKIGLTIFIILIISYAYFPQSYFNHNVISRMSLALSLIEDGTVTINKFHEQTGDKAIYKGNYYSDKAPGLSFTALPLVAVSKTLLRVYGKNQDWINKKVNLKFGFIVYFCTVFTSGLFTAISALLIYFLSLRIGARITGAVFAMLSFGLASPAWGWATAFLGHAMSGSCLFIAFASIILLSQKPPDKRRDVLLGFLAGAVLSWAVVVEFTAAIPLAVIMVFGISKAIKWDKKRAARVLLSATIGGIIFVTPLLIYNFVVFDSPFVIGYSQIASDAFPGMKDGFFGITYPRPQVLFMILFSPYRGIFWFSPILLIAPIGIYYLWRRPDCRGIALTITLISVYYPLLNSAYYYWEGGWSTGPRHITPMLPFLCLSLSMMWTEAGLKWKPALISLFFLSFGISLICVSVSMFSPSKIQNPLFDFLIPRFLDEKLTCSPFKIGISGHAALIPIFAFWAIGGIYVLKLMVNHKRGL